MAPAVASNGATPVSAVPSDSLPTASHLGDAEMLEEATTISSRDREPEAKDVGLAYIGEVLSIGPELTVRWMDGSTGTVPPEELYVVNTDEEEQGFDEFPDLSYDEDEDEDSYVPRGQRGTSRASRRVHGDCSQGDAGDSSGWETVPSDEEGSGDAALREEMHTELGDAESPTNNMMLTSVSALDEEAEVANIARRASHKLSAASDGRRDTAADCRSASPLSESLTTDAPAPISEPLNECDDDNYASAEDLDVDDDSHVLHPAETDVPPPATSFGPLSDERRCSLSAEDAASELEKMDRFWVEEDCDSSWHYYRQGSASVSAAPAATPYGTAFARVAQKQWKQLQVSAFRRPWPPRSGRNIF